MSHKAHVAISHGFCFYVTMIWIVEDVNKVTERRCHYFNGKRDRLSHSDLSIVQSLRGWLCVGVTVHAEKNHTVRSNVVMDTAAVVKKI